MFWFSRKEKQDVDLPMPYHVGVIMDGNGRWAKKRMLDRRYGHVEGAKTFKEITEYARKIGIKYITYYAFSTENWKRPKEEIDGIMKLFDEYLDDVVNYKDMNVKLVFVGDKSRLSENLQIKMTDIEEKSKDFDSMTVAIAVNYGGRNEIVDAAKNIALLSKEGKLSVEDIDEKLLSSKMYDANMPDVDLLIRPGGEKRISNFLIWQNAYAELYFTDVLWPDFTTDDFDKALKWYGERHRRFGGI